MFDECRAGSDPVVVHIAQDMVLAVDCSSPFEDQVDSMAAAEVAGTVAGTVAVDDRAAGSHLGKEPVNRRKKASAPRVEEHRRRGGVLHPCCSC